MLSKRRPGLKLLLPLVAFAVFVSGCAATTGPNDIVADLPAGEYVLDARARMPGGDASYGFRLTVKEPDAAAGDSPAFATVRF